MTKLNAYNECNEREINSMVGKAACAWANYLTVLEMAKDPNNDGNFIQVELAAKSNEYEATIRCIDMFVRESLYEIQHLVIAEAEKMMAK